LRCKTTKSWGLIKFLFFINVTLKLKNLIFFFKTNLLFFPAESKGFALIEGVNNKIPEKKIKRKMK